MAAQGFISLEAGIALAFGANIGTCVTAMLAAIGKPREAVRAAMVHVLFNVFGVLTWVGLISYLAEFVTWLSPISPGLSGTEKLAAEAPRQIANAHTVFNIANTFIFISFTSQFARLVEWLVPDKPIEEIPVTEPKYLDEELLDTPSLALDRVRLEIGHMGERVNEMVEQILPAVVSGKPLSLREIARIDNEVDILHGHIITYLGNISRKTLTSEQTQKLVGLMAAVNDLENIGDIIETDLVHLGNERIEQNISISEQTREVLARLHAVVSDTVSRVIIAVRDNDQQAAKDVILMKTDINQLVDAAATHQAMRLVVDEPHRLAAYTLEIDIIERLKRIYYFAKRMAKAVMPEEVDEHEPA